MAKQVQAFAPIQANGLYHGPLKISLWAFPKFKETMPKLGATALVRHACDMVMTLLAHFWQPGFYFLKIRSILSPSSSICFILPYTSDWFIKGSIGTTCACWAAYNNNWSKLSTKSFRRRRTWRLSATPWNTLTEPKMAQFTWPYRQQAFPGYWGEVNSQAKWDYILLFLRTSSDVSCSFCEEVRSLRLPAYSNMPHRPVIWRVVDRAKIRVLTSAC